MSQCPACGELAPPRLSADLALHDCKTDEWDLIEFTDKALDHLRASGRGSTVEAILADRRRRQDAG